MGWEKDYNNNITEAVKRLQEAYDYLSKAKDALPPGRAFTIRKMKQYMDAVIDTAVDLADFRDDR